jgi:hypothetical protein
MSVLIFGFGVINVCMSSSVCHSRNLLKTNAILSTCARITHVWRRVVSPPTRLQPQHVGRNFAGARGSEDGTIAYGQGWGQGSRGTAAPSSSLKRKSDTGRYNVSRVERRLVPEPGR